MKSTKLNELNLISTIRSIYMSYYAKNYESSLQKQTLIDVTNNIQRLSKYENKVEILLKLRHR